jgi:hypothetical protein
MNFSSNQEIAETRIKLQHTTRKDSERSTMFLAYEELDRLIHDDLEEAWKVIRIIYKTDSSGHMLANVAAGPVEDILVYHGEEFIDPAEQLADNDPIFKKLLGAVWRNNIPQDVWMRVKAVAGPDF